MADFSLQSDEADRLLAVRSLIGAGYGATPEIAALAALGRHIFATDVAAVHIVDEDWLRVAGAAGLQLGECPRDIALCNSVVSARDMIVFEDLAENALTAELPYVTADPRLRFYAGAPVASDEGLVVGTFCILDRQPRKLSEQEVQHLQHFALVAGGLLRLQKANFAMTVAEQGLRTAAMTDPMTGFYNRSALASVVDEALSDCLRRGRTFGALYLDMDGFKGINDRFGHHAGDAVLAQAAERIRSAIRPDTIALRMGGDEFAVFVPDPPDVTALGALAERLLIAFRRPFVLEGREIDARLSIGAALAPQSAIERAELLRIVDGALYRAKEAGRDCFSLLS